VALLTAVVVTGFLGLVVWATSAPSGPVAQARSTEAEPPPASEPVVAGRTRVEEKPPTPPTEPLPPPEQEPVGPPAPERPAVTPLPEKPAEPPPNQGRPEPPPPEPAPQTTGRFKAGDTFYQEVVVTRLSAYRILGAEVGQNVQYAFVSRFTVEKVERDGSVVVKQKVESARFGNGDPAMQALLEGALKKTEGAAFEMTVAPGGEVTRFKGAAAPPEVFGGANPLGGQTFLMWSFLDEDAWRELAQITFFRPEKSPGQEKWSRKMSHGWGPLGRWAGQTTYAATGKQAGLDRIAYAHEMTYHPPARGAGGLPFQVAKAEFKPLAAGGVILFDPGRDRVGAAEETFRVRGQVVVSSGGTEAAVEMDEAQVFRLRVLDQAPGK
jgi:hypothetical protein